MKTFGRAEHAPSRNWLAPKRVPWLGFCPNRTICCSETKEHTVNTRSALKASLTDDTPPDCWNEAKWRILSHALELIL